MNDCPTNEKPSPILSEARDYVKQMNTSSYGTVAAETALNLAEAAYSDSQGHPGDRSSNFAPAQQNIDSYSGWSGVGSDTKTATTVAVELAKAAHFDKLNQPLAADLSLESAQKIVDTSYSNLSWTAYPLVETAIGIAKANHLDAQGKPDQALKAFDEVTQSTDKFYSHLTWNTLATRDVAVDLAKFRYFDRHDKPKEAEAALQAAKADAVAHNNDWTRPNNDTRFKLQAAITIEEAGQMSRRGECSMATQMLSDLSRRAESERGNWSGNFSNVAAIKVHSAIAVAKVGILTGQDVSPATSLLLTEQSLVGGKSKVAR